MKINTKTVGNTYLCVPWRSRLGKLREVCTVLYAVILQVRMHHYRIDVYSPNAVKK